MGKSRLIIDYYRFNNNYNLAFTASKARNSNYKTTKRNPQTKFQSIFPSETSVIETGTSYMLHVNFKTLKVDAPSPPPAQNDTRLPLLEPQVTQTRIMSIGEHRHCFRNIKICMGKKPVVSVTHENERISIKTAYLTRSPWAPDFLKMCVTSPLGGPWADLWPFYGL